LRGKRLAVLGLSFKGETDDIRESPAIELVEMLLAEGSSIIAYDPAAMERAQERLIPSAHMQYAASAEQAFQDADALLILTDWKQFSALDLDHLRTALRYPIVLDGRNLYDPAVMAAHGLSYFSVGRSAAVPTRQEVTATA
ncbi:MAG: UDP binding domain-containing protein, partial [Bryocella sp.]